MLTAVPWSGYVSSAPISPASPSQSRDRTATAAVDEFIADPNAAFPTSPPSAASTRPPPRTDTRPSRRPDRLVARACAPQRQEAAALLSLVGVKYTTARLRPSRRLTPSAGAGRPPHDAGPTTLLPQPASRTARVVHRVAPRPRRRSGPRRHRTPASWYSTEAAVLAHAAGDSGFERLSPPHRCSQRDLLAAEAAPSASADVVSAERHWARPGTLGRRAGTRGDHSGACAGLDRRAAGGGDAPGRRNTPLLHVERLEHPGHARP